MWHIGVLKFKPSSAPDLSFLLMQALGYGGDGLHNWVLLPMWKTWTGLCSGSLLCPGPASMFVGIWE